MQIDESNSANATQLVIGRFPATAPMERHLSSYEVASVAYASQAFQWSVTLLCS